MAALIKAPLIAFAKKVMYSVLRKFTHGELRFIYKNQDSKEKPKNINFGCGTPSASIYIHDEWVWVRVFFSGSLVRIQPFYSPTYHPHVDAANKHCDTAGASRGVYAGRSRVFGSLYNFQGTSRLSRLIFFTIFRGKKCPSD